MNRFEEKRAARIQRLIERASNKESESNVFYVRSSKMASIIPFGQPILVGHHSEKRDRRYRTKIGNLMDKSVEASREAEELERRAEAAMNNNAIYSEDPEALKKLKEKLESLEKQQSIMKAVNAIIRKKKLSVEDKKAEIVRLGLLKESDADTIVTPDCWGGIGFPHFSLTNNNANMNRIKKRIEHLEKQHQRGSSEKEIGSVKIVENVEDNRCQIFFPDKPSEECRTVLKSNGFRWSPYNGCWQRHRSNYASNIANSIVTKFYAE